LFLSGGASIMPYTAQFFAEKLNVPVEYLNPFRSVQIDPGVNLEELARVAHSLGEVVGLGLRNLAHCPVELNLMPDSTLRWQSFNQKKPYFIATVFLLVGMAFAVGFLFEKLSTVKADEVTKLEPQIAALSGKEQKFGKAQKDLDAAKKELGHVGDYLENRQYWAKAFKELREAFIRAEDFTRMKLGTDTGVWIETLNTMTPSSADPNNVSASPTTIIDRPGPIPVGRGMSPEEEQSRREMMKRYGLDGSRSPTPQAERPPMAAAPPPSPGATPGATGSTNELINITCRAVSLSHVSPDADLAIAYAVDNELKKCPLFDPNETRISPQLTPDEPTHTFTFGVTLAFKKPLKL
jgi:hypothetical protein